jgi:hypothetical protein
MLRKYHLPQRLWAITCYFNPCGYRRRAINYRTFWRHLQIPLLTVELSFDGRFELQEHDADRLIQLRAADVMWQKERLLNVGIRALPAECDRVAWIVVEGTIPQVNADANGPIATRSVFSVIGLPPESRLMKFDLLNGTPLDGDPHGVVVNTELFERLDAPVGLYNSIETVSKPRNWTSCPCLHALICGSG